MSGIRLAMPVAVLRLVACAILIASQAALAARCDACAQPFFSVAAACGTRVTDGEEAMAPACPACIQTASGGDHREASSSPCRCQWEPKEDVPLAPPHMPALDAVAYAGATAWVDADAGGTHPAATAVAPSHVPQRPVRILLGVWRN